MSMPVYLRDLKPSMQEEMLETWRTTTPRSDLIHAHQIGEDIIVGYYIGNTEMKVEE